MIDYNCGHPPHAIIPLDYKHGVQCPMCKNVSSKQAKDNLINLLKNNEHKLLSDYVNDATKILIDYNCNHEPHWIKPNAYKNGGGCPRCIESKGEKIIKEWLEKNYIEHQAQLILPNKRWKYDIYIPFENLIIEVQGFQHYEYCFFHELKGITLEEEQENDHEKRNMPSCLVIDIWK